MEYADHEGDGRRLAQAEDRIRALEQENERLVSALADALKAKEEAVGASSRDLLEENERLRGVHETTCRDTSRVIEAQQAKIEAALALHQPWVSSTGKKFCKACSSGYYKIEHPCPTIEALTGEGLDDAK